MSDRRRINGPSSGTVPPVFTLIQKDLNSLRPVASRDANQLRSVYLKTGLVPSASGSAYIELPPSEPFLRTFLPGGCSPKLSCVVHGPKPLPRNASYSPNLQLAASVKFAPFASRSRRGYIRDTSERELGVHLETALKGVIIADRWPKSTIDVSVTILEGEEDQWWGNAISNEHSLEGCGLINTLSACITVASAALADAGIDCLDLITGGNAAISRGGKLWLDASPHEHIDLTTTCSLAYISSRDEITEIWLKGDISSDPDEPSNMESIIDGAVMAARAANPILQAAVRESAERRAAGITSATTLQK